MEDRFDDWEHHSSSRTVSTFPLLFSPLISAAEGFARKRPSSKAKFDLDLVLVVTAAQGFMNTELMSLRLCSRHLLQDLSPLVHYFHVVDSFKSDFTDFQVLAATNRFAGIRFANLSNCPCISNIGFSAIIRLTLLRHLSLNGCAVSDVTFLSTSASLEVLLLRDTHVHDVSCLSACCNLEILRLDGSMICSSGLKELAHCPKLRILGLDDTPFDDTNVLERLLSLREIYMNRTNIAVLGALGNCESLEVLELADTKVQV